MLVDGKVLIAASAAPTAAEHFPPITYFYTFNYLTNTYTSVTAPNGAASMPIATYYTQMLALPNGQVLFGSFFSNQYYLFTPSGAALVAGKPTVTGITQLRVPVLTEFRKGQVMAMIVSKTPTIRLYV
jgi:hypothetical protein